MDEVPLWIILSAPLGARLERAALQREMTFGNLIAASIYDKYSKSASILPNCTRCCLTMTTMIQVCSHFRGAGVFIMNTRPDETEPPQNRSPHGGERSFLHESQA